MLLHLTGSCCASHLCCILSILHSACTGHYNCMPHAQHCTVISLHNVCDVLLVMPQPCMLVLCCQSSGKCPEVCSAVCSLPCSVCLPATNPCLPLQQPSAFPTLTAAKEALATEEAAAAAERIDVDTITAIASPDNQVSCCRGLLRAVLATRSVWRLFDAGWSLNHDCVLVPYGHSPCSSNTPGQEAQGCQDPEARCGRRPDGCAAAAV